MILNLVSTFTFELFRLILFSFSNKIIANSEMEKTDFKYCPECQAEYKPNIEICTDCNVSLVDTHPFDKPLEEITWIKIAQFSGKIYGEMAGEILSKNNIPYFLKSDFFASAFSISPTNVPGAVVKLLVPEDKKEQAKNLIINISE